jgi:hypothetical protein
MSEDQAAEIVKAGGVICRAPDGPLLMLKGVDTGDRLKLRRPIMAKWADFICPADKRRSAKAGHGMILRRMREAMRRFSVKSSRKEDCPP